ncbi:MAG TPA: tRNA (adenosine(37)-N6)-threonylcarbamoyltransferase complex ATPase subunit type 1 TsaE [Acidimicrobiales bacterium]|nr:tRNA (adenosine(37)-N6)-threonylcarbamoyltransferase complex ATPase subunit type 1 TsaE [Acidimicrobiales bacterium]
MIERHCATAEQTRAAGEEFAALLRPGDVVLLSGRLGAGKTTFVQGVARGLGVSERVTSPTFTLVRPHACSNKHGVATLYHADVYRAGSLAEVFDLDLTELIDESAVALVEWGETAAPVFGEVLTVTLTDDDAGGRHLAVAGALVATRAHALTRWAGA